MNSSHTRYFTERSVQTDERFASSTEGYRFKYMDQEDAVAVTSTYHYGHVLRPLADLNENVYNLKLASQQYLPVDEVYDGIRNPFVLVINNVNFYNTRDPRPRNGAVHDLHNVRAFCEGAGFRTVVEHFDLTKEKMLKELEKIRQTAELIDHDSFICIIMSHGNEEGILGADSRALPVDYITAKFRGGVCPQLATKPKLFFLQACRGDVDDDGYLIPRGGQGGHVYPDVGETEEMPVKLPSDADFLIAYSTTKGFVSYRSITVDKRVARTHGRTLGSWFISCLVQVLQTYSHREDLMTMLTRVNNSMTRQYTVHGRCKQISCQLSMLTKKVYFANYLEQETAAAAAI